MKNKLLPMGIMAFNHRRNHLADSFQDPSAEQRRNH